MKLIPWAAISAILLAQAGWGQGVIRLKSGAIAPRGDRAGRIHQGVRHLLLQFREYPGPEVRENLAQRGMLVLEYVPDNTLMVNVGAGRDLTGLDLLWVGALEPAEKISRALAGSASGHYLVYFHRDVEIHAARSLVAGDGLEVVETPGLLPNHLLIAGGVEGIARLAGHDEVAYIIPVDKELLLRKPPYRCPGAVTGAGLVADYALQGTGWATDASGSLTLGYFFDSFTAKLPESTVRSEVERAFTEWSRYANVTFTPAAGQNGARSVDILFASGTHGDAYPFDGPGGVLAHTFFPAPSNAETIAGDMHFDNADNWQVGGSLDLFTVALHEAGHALGLGHSDIPSAVMYPYYRPQTGLTSDDIAAVQALYGKRGASLPPTVAPVPVPAPEPAPVPTPTPVPAPTPPGGGDTTPPSIAILFPGSTILSTNSATIAVSGKASDNVGVASIAWSTSTGSAGIASGTADWSATIPLLVGDNTITLRAYDVAGNSAWRSLTVVRY